MAQKSNELQRALLSLMAGISAPEIGPYSITGNKNFEDMVHLIRSGDEKTLQEAIQKFQTFKGKKNQASMAIHKHTTTTIFTRLLIIASEEGYPNMVKMLLEAGANVDGDGEERNRPLFIVVQMAKRTNFPKKDYLKTVTLLLEHKAKTLSKMQTTIIHFGVCSEDPSFILPFLIKYFKDKNELVFKSLLNSPNKEGINAFNRALLLNRLQACKILLEAGANPKPLCEAITSMIFEKVRKKDIKSIQELHGLGVSLDLINKRGIPLLLVAVESHCIEMVDYLTDAAKDCLNRTTPLGQNALHYAIEVGQLAIAQRLIQRGIEIPTNPKTHFEHVLMNFRRETIAITLPLFKNILDILQAKNCLKELMACAVGENITPLAFHILEQNHEVIALLLKAGADPNQLAGPNWNSLLIETMNQQDFESFEILLKDPRVIGSINSNDHSALQEYVCGQKEGLMPQIVERAPNSFAFLSAIGDIRDIDSKYLKSLLAAGADPSLFPFELHPIFFALNVGRDDLLSIILSDQLQKGKLTESLLAKALNVAIERSNTTAIQLLLDADANPVAPAGKICTGLDKPESARDAYPLWTAVFRANPQKLPLLDPKVIPLLLNKLRALKANGLDLKSAFHRKSTNGFTIMHGAFQNEQWEIISFLINEGVSVNIKDDNDHVPFYYAIQFASASFLRKCLGLETLDILAQNINAINALASTLVSQDIDKLEVLLEAGFDPKINSPDGISLITMACTVCENPDPFIKLLHAFGVDVNQASFGLAPPIFVAASYSTVKLLQSLGAKDCPYLFIFNWYTALVSNDFCTIESTFKMGLNPNTTYLSFLNDSKEPRLLTLLYYANGNQVLLKTRLLILKYKLPYDFPALFKDAENSTLIRFLADLEKAIENFFFSESSASEPSYNFTIYVELLQKSITISLTQTEFSSILRSYMDNNTSNEQSLKECLQKASLEYNSIRDQLDLKTTQNNCYDLCKRINIKANQFDELYHKLQGGLKSYFEKHPGTQEAFDTFQKLLQEKIGHYDDRMSQATQSISDPNITTSSCIKIFKELFEFLNKLCLEIEKDLTESLQKFYTECIKSESTNTSKTKKKKRPKLGAGLSSQTDTFTKVRIQKIETQVKAQNDAELLPAIKAKLTPIKLSSASFDHVTKVLNANSEQLNQVVESIRGFKRAKPMTLESQTHLAERLRIADANLALTQSLMRSEKGVPNEKSALIQKLTLMGRLAHLLESRIELEKGLPQHIRNLIFKREDAFLKIIGEHHFVQSIKELQAYFQDYDASKHFSASPSAKTSPPPN